MDRLRRYVPRLDGAPFALPAVLDRCSEAWWRLPPRGRTAGRILAATAVVVIAGTGAARSPWGGETGVLVAARDLPAGHQLAADDLDRVVWPSAVAPPPVEAIGRRLAAGLPVGAAVTPGHLADGGAAAELAPGRVAVAVPADVLPPLTAGQRVDVLAARLDGSGQRLATGARVIAANTDRVVLAVERGAAPAVAGAAATGQVTAALLPASD